MTLKTIRTLWNHFENKVIPSEATLFIRGKMRMAFVAGFVSAYAILSTAKGQDELLERIKFYGDDIKKENREIIEGELGLKGFKN